MMGVMCGGVVMCGGCDVRCVECVEGEMCGCEVWRV